MIFYCWISKTAPILIFSQAGMMNLLLCLKIFQQPQRFFLETNLRYVIPRVKFKSFQDPWPKLQWTFKQFPLEICSLKGLLVIPSLEGGGDNDSTLLDISPFISNSRQDSFALENEGSDLYCLLCFSPQECLVWPRLRMQCKLLLGAVHTTLGYNLGGFT